MKKLLIFILILIFIAGVCVVTCPDKQAHKDALTEWFHSNSDKGSETAGYLSYLVDAGLFSFDLEMNLTVKNHFVYSTGNLGDKYKVTSIGVLGHVFTVKKK